ncbi:hypothetical protein [Plebeiibacterium sediminum]|uniref:SGNH hydrolase-type esterase domain-containing protein n=1 Tax=Plebeiibacterium sediminum TaxID=2992112 RepID=A0AAE3SE31_9BACT|nr:hypothetical protein [Plebeiobacterium sediminum]MCW3786073.1 hypothetical protein [Plebeiobacterium sediminum]
MIKPPKIFLYYLVIIGIFVGFSFLIPKEGLQIGTIPYRIKWISVHHILGIKADSVATKKIIQELPTDTTLSIALDTSIIADSIKSNLTQKIDSLALEPDTVITPSIEYGEEFKPLLYQFYSNITNAADSGKILRILHMGDSQIEGDRITRYLRESFQEQFKGSGPGLIPVFDPQKHFPSVWISNNGKWSEHTVYQYPRTIKNNQYGIIGRVAKIDSSGISSLKISQSHLALPKASRFYKARLYLKEIKTPLLVTAFWEGDQISKDSLLEDEGLTEINWTFKQDPQRFSLNFMSDESPIFLGLSLDSLSGIAVDNISMRGQSTPRLDKTNKALYKSMASYMNIGLVILQYGTNMVPTITSNYEFYSRTLYKQLQILKETMPNVPVLVVGVGDVATQTDGQVKSYTHITKIKEAQKEAAFKAGFAFFDLYEAMGGEGSMLKWVNNDPRMAMLDYTHFNKAGGKKVADWLYTAILHDYNKWKKSTTFKPDNPHND